MSEYIRKWEKKNNNGRQLDPNNKRDRKKIRKCMSEIKHVSASQEKKGVEYNRAPCPNCSQLIANLRKNWGGPSSGAVQEGIVAGEEALNETKDAINPHAKQARAEPPVSDWRKGRRSR